MQAKLFHDLEFEKIVDIIVSGSHSSAGKAIAATLFPLNDQAQIIYRQNLISEIQEVYKHGIDFDFSELLPLEEVFEATNQTVYDWEEFRLIYLNARLATEICQRRADLDGFKELYKILRRLFPLPEIVKQFDRIFDGEGNVKETASEELKRIYKKKTILREQIIRSLQRKFLDAAFENAVQEKFVTQRDGRYVIPIKESHAPHIKGIVQGQSGSKSTVYMEPEDVVGLNNDLQMIQQEEKREIFRIFQAFTADVRALEQQIKQNYELLSALDMWFSCGRLCHRLGSRVPEIVPEAYLDYKRARHPLLILQQGDVHKVIPFDLQLGRECLEYDFLILSGPNTGGKTVLLKAAGLLTLMALTGLPVPVDNGTRIGMFTSVMADIGDEQSIEAALSTFSSHISKIRNMLSQCNDKTLVLLDEIGAATDPQQGAALAQAMLEAFTRSGVKGIVTTHYTALKVFAENNPQCTNASMQFDLKSLIPTYQFQLGFPGDSFAIEVAAGLGLNPELIERAKKLTGSQNLEFTELIKRLQEEKKVLAQESWQLTLKNKNLEATTREYEQKIKAWDDEQKARKREFLKLQQQELIDWQKLLQNELEDIRQSDKDERRKKTEDLFSVVQEQQTQTHHKLTGFDKKKLTQAFDPKPGDTVWLSDFDTTAVIVDMRGTDVMVDMNGIRFKTKRSHIYETQKKQEEQVNQYSRVNTTSTASFELKILGLTFDEAEPKIDEFIDDALVAGLHNLRIVHGKGTGALRTKVRDYLRTKKVVKTIGTPPIEAGGSGVTVITI
jgi:DNA mismatch repair protein MutS2